jgi:hypothetical protein
VVPFGAAATFGPEYDDPEHAPAASMTLMAQSDTRDIWIVMLALLLRAISGFVTKGP